ncbi:hypothetical protein NQ315_013616 [Exocentrus adspersus]|uniref:Uncharacterized protein n=1 Tax=Exocentrus adspersus TaxID=1586481 RepID=A0AAV8W3J3_9CUCU|nr:hypothetical protein NQ315_013616 [Exocentrus adspersus]
MLSAGNNKIFFAAPLKGRNITPLNYFKRNTKTCSFAGNRDKPFFTLKNSPLPLPDLRSPTPSATFIQCPRKSHLDRAGVVRPSAFIFIKQEDTTGCVAHSICAFQKTNNEKNNSVNVSPPPFKIRDMIYREPFQQSREANPQYTYIYQIKFRDISQGKIAIH